MNEFVRLCRDFNVSLSIATSLYNNAVSYCGCHKMPTFYMGNNNSYVYDKAQKLLMVHLGITKC